MKKIRIGALARQLDVDLNKLISLMKEKLVEGQFSGNGRLAWITPEGAEILKLAVLAPLAVPAKLWARAILQARNPRWVYCTIEGKEGKFPVAIPNRLRGMLIGKRFRVDAITDVSGTTYRHEIIGK